MRKVMLETLEKLSKVKLVVSDVDGTMSRRIRLNHEGNEIKVFCEKDAPRIAAIIRCGIPFVMISGRNSPAARVRAGELKADFFYRAEMLKDEMNPLKFLEQKYGVTRDEILYIGDDWGDLWWMVQVGVSAAPSDAEEEVRKIADIVNKAAGGEGTVSEVLILLLRVKGLYEKVLQEQFQCPH